MCSVTCPVCLFVTPWTVARQDPLSMGFSRQEYWSGLPFPPPGDLPYPGIKPTAPVAVSCIAGEPGKKLSTFLRNLLTFPLLRTLVMTLVPPG